MLLTVDIGNTNVTLGVFLKEELLLTARLDTEVSRTVDQYAVDIKNVLSLYNKEPKEIKNCIIASVVPTVGEAVKKAVTLLCGAEPILLGPGVKTGLNIKIDNPAQLGADLVAGAVGVIGKYSMPCIVIDMGTATTVSVLDKNGSFIGGSIAAGVRLTLKALFENTALLPTISITAPQKVIATNTVDCMRSGLVYGTASMIDGLLDRIEEELGETPTVVATGGLSREIITYCRREIIYNENLLLDGLREIYEKNH
jgi:type III pantothenate kinase